MYDEDTKKYYVEGWYKDINYCEFVLIQRVT